MLEFEKPKIECVAMENGRYGKFVVEPLERGFGTTMGNSLRRVLLSSLPGAAVTAIKIDGIQHEFSTIPGVQEDVTEIILNLKELAVRLHSDVPKTLVLSGQGAGELTAADIAPDAELQIFNPDLHICTLNEDASLRMEITFENVS